MSADDGIYILKNLNNEFRVSHCQAIENITNPKISKEYQILYFGKSKIFNSYEESLLEAGLILKELNRKPEYGISYIELDEEFPIL